MFSIIQRAVQYGIVSQNLMQTQVGLSDERIEVVQLGQTLKKPRWYSHLSFAEKYKVGSVAIEIRNG